MSNVAPRIVELFDTLSVDDQHELAQRLVKRAQPSLFDDLTLAKEAAVSERPEQRSVGAWLVENMPRAANEADELAV